MQLVSHFAYFIQFSFISKALCSSYLLTFVLHFCNFYPIYPLLDTIVGIMTYFTKVDFFTKVDLALLSNHHYSPLSFHDNLCIFFLFYFADDLGCNTGPCRNGGRCIDTTTSFTCFCIGSFTGPTCSVRKYHDMKNTPGPFARKV